LPHFDHCLAKRRPGKGEQQPEAGSRERRLGEPAAELYQSEGARVGTVDKFQGQEAEAVLVSMATSGAEDMPRDAAFLLSRNRFNVAISRARCLAVLVASPGLLDIVANSVDEMRLANSLCWAADNASSTGDL